MATTEKSLCEGKFKPVYLVKLISRRLRVRSTPLKNAALNLKAHYSQGLDKTGLRK